MSIELKKQISDFLENKQNANDMYIMFCKISKRKDLQRQIKRCGKKSYNIRHVKKAVIRFVKLNPEYEPNNTDGVENLTIDGEYSGSGMPKESIASKKSVNGVSVTNDVKHGDVNKKDVGAKEKSVREVVKPAGNKQKYSDDDIIVRLKKRLADISNERSFLQSEMLKVGNGNDTKSILQRKKKLDTIKKLGSEYDILFNAKEDYFKTGIIPDISILKMNEPEPITVVKALGLRNNIRSQISRAKNKNKSLSAEKLIENNKRIESLQIEHDEYQKIIDNAS